MNLQRRAACVMACGLLAIFVAEPLKAGEIETIEVYADAPIGPAHGDAQRAVGNGQSLDSSELARPGNRAIGDALQDLGSVFATDATGNPFQPDLFYRGYSISPLLGLPQGIAVYQDGVRVNEAFGDTVNFDLIPLIALSRADLVPGSNPVFGRNTLGGALALTTKTGFDAKGVGVDMSAGEFGRRGLSAEVGVAGDTLALYLSGELFKEHGWRDFSDSRASRVFARGTWLPDAATQLDLSLTAADNRLRGDGAAPIDLIEVEGRDAVFTHPDETRPKLGFLNFNGSHKLEDGVTLSLGTYFRRNRARGFNGDGTEYEACGDPVNVNGAGQAFLCEIGNDGEDVVRGRDGNPVVAGDDNDSATRNRSHTRQDSYGLSAQIEKLVGAHRLVAGGSVDFGDIRFTSDSELGRLTDSRGTIGSGVFVADSRVDVHADNDGVGVYLMDTWRATERLELVAAGRWNRSTIELRDQLPGGDLSGRHGLEQPALRRGPRGARARQQPLPRRRG